ncbi:arylamine N-acetyltransferase, pineal gland isozyme NAT-10-like [Dunckerocampus dactyliophorus]|uniref:arylamine N-acetyltransferase, pineal gland isozyme NAT-10-like n=1 Tax=Dunckerocampus dactyliophorus TaxID=161453 RepID=UPI002406F3A2|nr:arylamine N-acetyltransferase, pineal gland isozyme NAT-10-like [Dunckerocampus dactyliophorus]XP_054626788.1 arylamine N-acetyltransferase, pineal gland isozyme NAT-10-like [Dunckerocampus dactyliophorus]
MNLEAYFQRIGFYGPRDKADLATLKLIHKHHVMSVPFENLSIHCGETIIMDLDVIFDKIVRRNRGGWCLENNFLFSWVLKELGYAPTILGARVFSSTTGDFGPCNSHLINKVDIEGKAYIADVSFGVSSQLWEPLELVHGKDQPQRAAVFRLLNKGDVWVLEKSSRKSVILNPDFASSSLVNRKLTKTMYCFTMTPKVAEDFFEVNSKLQTDPSTLFTNKSICSLQTPSGFRALIGCIYSEVTYKPEEGVDVFDMRDVPVEEVEQVLRDKFSIRLQNKLQPVNKAYSYTL